MIPSTKEKILAATMDLIKSEGLDGVTIRKIAGLAGTNVALVNYYFGSKEKLISETLKLQLYSLRAAFSVFDEMELPPLERIKKFLLSYTASLQEHPDLIQRMLGQERIFESQTEYAAFLKSQGFEKLGSTITEITSITNRDTIVLILQQIFGAILSPIIKSSFNHKTEMMDKPMYHSNSSVEEQIDLFLDHYFYKYTTQ